MHNFYKIIFIIFFLLISMSLSFVKEPDFVGVWIYIDPQIAAENTSVWTFSKDIVKLMQTIETESGPIKNEMHGSIISYNERKKQIKFKISLIEGMFEGLYKKNTIIYIIYKIGNNYLYVNDSDKNYPNNVNEKIAYEKYQ